jgi:hypothetical protein
MILMFTFLFVYYVQTRTLLIEAHRCMQNRGDPSYESPIMRRPFSIVHAPLCTIPLTTRDRVLPRII